jgi:hypothetical protein
VADVGRNAGVRHAGWQAGKRLGAAEAHRELEYLQRVEKFESSGLAADDVERERGARAGALPLEQKAGGCVLVEVSKVMDLSHVGVVAQIIRHKPRIYISLFPCGCSTFRATG